MCVQQVVIVHTTGFLVRLMQPSYESFRDAMALAKSVDALEEVSMKLKARVMVRRLGTSTTTLGD